MYGAVVRAAKSQGKTLARVCEEMAADYLEKLMEPDDFKSLMVFVDEYYPPFKSKEVKAFWEHHLGLDE